jgi:nicotinate-nucleotide adenylyltransferase
LTQPTRARRIGLLGGSFDPVHNAHLALAREALAQLQLDELRWVPAGQPWQKTRQLAAPGHRAAMVQRAIAGEPRFVLDHCELQRTGPSYMLDTVSALQAATQAATPGAQWFLIVGQDQYAGLHTWHQWQALMARVTLAVARRPGALQAVSPEVLAALGPGAPVVVQLPALAISSTDIRARLAAGQGIDDLVPPEVARYIDQHHLYRGTRGN